MMEMAEHLVKDPNGSLQAYQNKVALQRQQEIASHGSHMHNNLLVQSPGGGLSPRSPMGSSPLGSMGNSPLGSPQKSHKCQHCYKAFPSTQQLGQHSLVHSNVRKYACLYCDKTFKQLSHLQQHHRRHTGERPYRCPFAGCDKAFAQLSNLQQHQKNHENKKAAEEQRPYFCRICDRRFSSDNGLTKHIAKVHGEGRDLRRGPLPPNILANPSQLLAVANMVTAANARSQSAQNNRAALLSLPGQNLNLTLPAPTSTAALAQTHTALCPPLPTSSTSVKMGFSRLLRESENHAKASPNKEEEEIKIVRSNLEALSKKDLNLLKSSRSRLYDFPTQVPTVLSAAYSSPQQDI